MWIDIRAKLKDDGEFRGMMIDPLDVDAHLPEPIDIRQKGKRRKMLSRTFVTIPILQFSQFSVGFNYCRNMGFFLISMIFIIF